MSDVVTLEQLAALAGDERVSLKKPTENDPFLPNTAYPVAITEQTVTESKNGYNQLELHISIIESDGNLKPAGRIWEGLPVFTDEVMMRETHEKVEELRVIFGRNLHSLLRAVDPVTFSIYRSKSGKGSSTQYFDENGIALSRIERDEKAALLEQSIIGAAKALLNNTFSLVDKRFYFVKVTSPKGKVYQNYFSDVPEKWPLASV